MLDIDAQHLLQMAASHDQQPVQALSADRAHPALREGIGVGRLGRCQYHLRALSAEEVVKGAAELGIPIPQDILNMSPLLAEYQQQVACLLSNPGAVRVGSDPGQVDAPGGQSDKEQHIEPSQPDGVDGEEVAGEDPSGLLAKKRLPRRRCPPWRRVQAMPAQRFADRGCRDPDPKPEQLALDALVAPTRILPCQADDQLLHALVEWRTPTSTTGICPRVSDQAAMPAQQRLGSDDEARPACPWQRPAEDGRHGTVDRLELGSRNLAPQHGELVA
jgi:hypothetical protein